MKYIAVIFFIFIIIVIVLADNGSLPHSIHTIYDIPHGDKLGHFILFGLLNFFVTRAFPSSFPSKARMKEWEKSSCPISI
jgi:polysaccharide biosynthesis protein VpsQ